MKQTFEIFSGLIILAFMGTVLWQITHPASAPSQPVACTLEAKLCPDGSTVGREGPNCRFAECPDVQAEPITGTTDAFRFELEEMVRIEMGQPIEGFEPAMFMQVFPSLLPKDFNNVEAEIGMYKYMNNELKHEMPQDVMVHSAASAITEEGMSTLMENVINRLGHNPKSTTVEQIIRQLSSDGAGGPVYAIPTPPPVPMCVYMNWRGEHVMKHCDSQPVPTTPTPGEPVACTMDAKQCPDGSYVGRVGPNCEFEPCPNTPTTPIKSITCPTGSELVDACIEIYQPVCGLIEIQCITTPCDPIPQTFSNSCFACMEKNVTSYTEGACVDDELQVQ